MLKRISKILLCVLLLFFITACTNDENSLPNNNDVQNNEEEKNDENIPSKEENIYSSNKEPEEAKEDIITKLTNEIPTGYKLYTHNVSMSDTFGNSILPNSYIGIYAKTDSKEGYIIANIKVLAVLDENNENAFSENEVRTPSKILFYLSDNDYGLLQKAKVLGEIRLIPGGTSSLNQEVIDYILNS